MTTLLRSTLPILALAFSSTLAACSNSATGTKEPTGADDTSNDPNADPSGTTGPGTPGTGDVPANAVGIWQVTAASGGDFTNSVTGQDFTVTQGFSARLKIRANGQYAFEHYSSGASATCASVTSYDKSVGTATLQGGRLVLNPTSRTLDVRACAESGTRTLANDPIAFNVAFSPYETLIKETTLLLELTNGPYPLKLRLLQLEPTADAPVVPQPPDFQLGADPPYTELVGKWAPSEGSDLGFYDPATGASYTPKYNGAEHRWVSFSPGGYEMATSFEDAGGADSGVCKKDLVYYERGTATFAQVRKENDTVFGDVRFEAEDARLVVTIRGCDEDDGVKTYTLKPHASYFKWQYTASVGFGLGCEYPKQTFQFAACTNNVGWNSLKKRS